MNKKQIGRSALYLSMTLALAACGGGGSDDGDSGGSLGLDPGGYSERQASIGALSDVDAVMALYEDATGASELIWEVESEIETWGTPVPNGNVYTQTCENEGGTVVATINSDDMNDDEQWQFTNCEVTTPSFGRLRLNGTYRYVDKLTAETAQSDTWKGYESFEISGNFLDSNEALRIQGREDWDEHYDLDGFNITSRIDALEFVRGARYVAISEGSFNIVENSAGESYSLNANVIGSAIDGYVTLSTPTRITTPVDNSCPAEGVNRIEGEGYAEVRYGTSTGTADAVVVEVNGNRAKALATCTELNQEF